MSNEKQPAASIKRTPENDYTEQGLFGTTMELKTYQLGVNEELSDEKIKDLLNAVCDIFHKKKQEPQY